MCWQVCCMVDVDAAAATAVGRVLDAATSENTRFCCCCFGALDCTRSADMAVVRDEAERVAVADVVEEVAAVDRAAAARTEAGASSRAMRAIGMVCV